MVTGWIVGGVLFLGVLNKVSPGHSGRIKECTIGGSLHGTASWALNISCCVLTFASQPITLARERMHKARVGANRITLHMRRAMCRGEKS